MMILSTIPMALSSVYKEIALGETELDPIFLNGWVAVFQFLFSIVIAVPASLTTGVAIPDLPGNMYDGLRCYVGKTNILDLPCCYCRFHCHHSVLSMSLCLHQVLAVTHAMMTRGMIV